ncbi:uncharacterized protein L969DRAFT_91489 [Mixia osmundae IAM 14324]|uniref:Uncharacterized protein n=1 Tax=Mixia osmundae (strain CBS 9802 / IAM 14324 / JCM 22182 / KY 12970) TaxID=764103 RepID=G7E417_MIXOS|nr:uncharacterized protein L969DRAFT_91489 [Mixia osmundae IAM 14324]KEI42023.1 hypothetical protein L969DRAFT_91489 [Mixia osmundae IAM 14324]GAA97577.1 hypothetical protein E5Q_04255 [Mixia osmundae IAM 14324]
MVRLPDAIGRHLAPILRGAVCNQSQTATLSLRTDASPLPSAYRDRSSVLCANADTAESTGAPLYMIYLASVSGIVCWPTSMATLAHDEAPDLPELPNVIWKYEMRRQAQEIIPRLWCGPYQSSNNLATLKSQGITHILCIADTREGGLVKPKFPNDFEYQVLNIRDSWDQNLITVFPEVAHFMEHALSTGGALLVHCGDGISRSPAIVTAYIMVKYRLGAEEACSYVRGRRFCVSPNVWFQHQIGAYEGIYRAQNMMHQAGEQEARDVSRRKRLDADDEADNNDPDAHHILMTTLNSRRSKPLPKRRNVSDGSTGEMQM